MRKLLLVAGASSATADSTATASEGELGTLDNPRPAWLTDELEAKIIAAGTKGLEVNLGPNPNATELNCLGTSPPYVGADGVSVTALSAGACMVPSGCTMTSSSPTGPRTTSAPPATVPATARSPAPQPLTTPSGTS